MKIAELRVHPLATDFAQPCWTAHERFDRAQLTLVEVRTDAGLVGIGEVSSGPQAQVVDYLRQFAGIVVGMDPLDHEAVWDRLMSLTAPRPGGIPGWDGLPPPLPRHHRGQIMAAIGGIDIALWDLKGKAAGLPVFRLLGGTRTEVFTYATGGFYVEGVSPMACAEELAGYVAQGHRAVKLKTGALSPADEVARVAATRRAIGPDILLMLDMNAPYDVEDCIAFARAVEPHGIFWLEEPLYWYLQPSDFARLAAATPIPLAHGEREWHRHALQAFIDHGAIGYAQFDSTRHAGFTEALRIARHAEARGVKVAPHTAPHIHRHLVSALGDAAFAAESVGDPGRHPIHHAILSDPADARGAMVRLSEEPGFGYAVDWAQVERLRA